MWNLGLLGASVSGVAGAYDLLETVALTQNTNSIDFQNINTYSDYDHLEIRLTARSDRISFDDDPIALNFNSDTSNSYTTNRLIALPSGLQALSTVSGARVELVSVTAADSATNYFGSGIINIMDFNSSAKNTTVQAIIGMNDANIINILSGLYASTNAITSIELTSVTGNNFISGSRFSLYGYKGA